MNFEKRDAQQGTQQDPANDSREQQRAIQYRNPSKTRSGGFVFHNRDVETSDSEDEHQRSSGYKE